MLQVRACARTRGVLHSPSHFSAKGSPRAPPRYTQKGAPPCISKEGGPDGAGIAASDVALLRDPPPNPRNGGGRAAGRFSLQYPSKCGAPSAERRRQDAHLASLDLWVPGPAGRGRGS